MSLDGRSRSEQYPSDFACFCLVSPLYSLHRLITCISTHGHETALSLQSQDQKISPSLPTHSGHQSPWEVCSFEVWCSHYKSFLFRKTTTRPKYQTPIRCTLQFPSKYFTWVASVRICIHNLRPSYRTLPLVSRDERTVWDRRCSQ